MASLSILTSACGDLAKRLESKVGAVNLLLDTRPPFAIGSAGVPSQAGVIVNFIGIEGSIAAPTASPITGANVTMTVGTSAGSAITLNENSPGSYSAVSGSSGTPTFVYASNQTYAISMVIAAGSNAGTYTTKIKAPPRTEVSGLPDSTQGQFQPHGQPLALTITSGSYDYGIVAVVDSAGNTTYTNKPQSPQDYLNFVLGNFSGTINIPGTAFPNPGVPYGIVVAGVRSAPASGISPNLEILSRFMAGSAKSAIVVTN
ncbi:MAG TPA: hypothetical protein VMV18_12665 [bacterium]|nr:hypothetical protein [bacterium]